MSHLFSSCAPLRFALWLLCCVPFSAAALGLGDIHVRSAMGQKLDAEIEFSSLTASEAESLTIKLAAPESFVQAGIDYTPVLRSIRFSVVKKGDQQVIRLSSDMAISDPFLNLLIEFNAAGNRTVRQYAVLLDPPVIAEPPVVVNVPEALAERGSVLTERTRVAEAKAAPTAGSASPPVPVKNVKNKPEKTITHVVKRGETLTSLAAAHREEDVSNAQMLLALQQANPHAFIGNNLNRLRAGSVLRIPESDAVRAVDPIKARESLRAQHAEFQHYRERLARQSVQSRDTALMPGTGNESRQSGARSSSGIVTLQSQEIPSTSVTQDKLKLTAPAPDNLPESSQFAAASKDSEIAGTKENKARSNEQSADGLEQIASDKALADANSRIAALEKNIRDMQQLASVQDQLLTEKQVAGTTLAEPPAFATEALPSSATPTPAPAAALVQQSESVLLELLQDPPLMMAGIAGLLLLLSWFGLRYRRRTPTSAEKTIESEGGQSVFEQAGGRSIDTSNSVFHSNFVPSVSQLDTNEVDAVAEADLYIAYGRDEQAEEILQDALRLHPDRHALRVKLMEIYAARKDRQKFGTLAAELRVLTHGVGEAWTQAAQMGLVLDPGNLLYGAALREEATRRNDPATPKHESVSVGNAQPVKQTSPVADVEFRLEGLLDEQKNDPESAANFAIRPVSSAGLKAAETSKSAMPIDSSHLLEFSLSDSSSSSFPSSPVTMTGSKSAGLVHKSVDLATLQTKFDLAIACDEIGDKEGARELLAEVAGGPDAALAQRAQSLLSQLA